MYLANPFTMCSMWHKVSFFLWCYRWFEFSFPSPNLVAVPKLKNLVCLIIHSMERRNRFIPFPSVFVLSEIQTVPSRIWPLVTVFISYNYNCDMSVSICCLFFCIILFLWEGHNYSLLVNFVICSLGTLTCLRHQKLNLTLYF